MTKLSIAFFAGVMVAASHPALAKQSGEEKLSRILSGRVAEHPVRCIKQSKVTNVQVVDRTAIVYGSGTVVYVNRTAAPRDIRSSYTMVYRNRSGDLCRLDTIYLVDQGTRARAGLISLDNFVPWRRIK